MAERIFKGFEYSSSTGYPVRSFNGDSVIPFRINTILNLFPAGRQAVMHVSDKIHGHRRRVLDMTLMFRGHRQM
jgi:hypothetical protein